MTVKNVEKLEKSRVAVTVEVGAEEFEAAVAKAYAKARGKLSIPGFRPGKAPRKIVESMYGAEVFYEAIPRSRSRTTRSTRTASPSRRPLPCIPRSSSVSTRA